MGVIAAHMHAPAARAQASAALGKRPHGQPRVSWSPPRGTDEPIAIAGQAVVFGEETLAIGGGEAVLRPGPVDQSFSSLR